MGGLACKDDAGVLMRRRAIQAGSYRFSVVVDFVGLGGVPGCWPAQLLEWCSTEGRNCVPLPGRRACIDIGPLDAGISDTQLTSSIASALRARTITSDAPDEPVLIRLVVTAQSCAEVTSLTTPFVPKSLMGCVISCPVVLDTVESSVSLGLPTLTDQCEPSVDACAKPRLGGP